MRGYVQRSYKKEKEKEEDPPFKTIPKEKKKVVSHGIWPRMGHGNWFR